MNFGADRVIQTSFLNEEQCLFWTLQFGKIGFVWRFSLCRSPPGHHVSSQYTPGTSQFGSSNNSVCRSCVHHLACHSLYLLHVRWWLLFLHSPIASTTSVLLAGATSAQELINILEPPIKADPSTRVFSCSRLDVSNTAWMGSCFHICRIPWQCKFVGLACATIFLSAHPEGVRGTQRCTRRAMEMAPDHPARQLGWSYPAWTLGHPFREHIFLLLHTALKCFIWS